jgi:hypothetical protein
MDQVETGGCGGSGKYSHDNTANALTVENTFIALNAMETVYGPQFYGIILRKYAGFDNLLNSGLQILIVRLFCETDGRERGRQSGGYGIQIGEMKGLGPVLRTILLLLL